MTRSGVSLRSSTPCPPLSLFLFLPMSSSSPSYQAPHPPVRLFASQPRFAPGAPGTNWQDNSEDEEKEVPYKHIALIPCRGLYSACTLGIVIRFSSPLAYPPYEFIGRVAVKPPASLLLYFANQFCASRALASREFCRRIERKICISAIRSYYTVLLQSFSFLN